jgi:hypothetical protein
MSCIFGECRKVQKNANEYASEFGDLIVGEGKIRPGAVEGEDFGLGAQEFF